MKDPLLHLKGGPDSPSGRTAPLFFDDVSSLIVQVVEQAKREGIRAVLCGGMAVQMYGFVRATKDIDFIAERPLNGMKKAGNLAFGGDIYEVSNERITTTVDWILREDEKKIIYDEVIKDLKTILGVPVITPEWLVIVKIAANRSKDDEDIAYLLGQDGLVDRSLIERHYRRLFNGAAFGYIDHFANLCLMADFMKARNRPS